MAKKNITRRGMVKAVGLGLLGAGMALMAAGCSASGEGGDAGESKRAPVQEDSSAEYDTVWLYSPIGFTDTDASVDSKLVGTMEQGGLTKPLLAGQSDAKTEPCYTNDLYPDVNELFYHRGWTDGLPIVPPIEQNVIAMSKGTDLPRQEVLGALAPIAGQATVENVAVNAVMAGCHAIHLPFLISAVQAEMDSAFDLVSTSTTTSPNATLLLVSGPAGSQVGVNGGANALGRGWRANAAMGRALHLVEQNVGGCWPVVSDFSTLGMPGDFSFCFAENDVESPWSSFAEEQGFGATDNVVTVASGESVMLVVDIDVSPKGFLKRVADVVAGREHIHARYLLIVTPSTARQLSDDGWDKEEIRSFVKNNTRVPPSRLANLTDWNQKAGVSDLSGEEANLDENGLVAVPFVEELYIVVAGGVGEKNALVPLWSMPVSREVVLPEKWDELLEGCKERARAFGVTYVEGTNVEGVVF